MTTTTTTDTPAPRWITYVRLPDLIPALRNPKQHDLPSIVASIQRHGFTNPVLRCDRTNTIAGGHGRVEALLNMAEHGYPHVPHGLITDPDDGVWCVPTIAGWGSHDDAELEAYIITDNRLTEAGGWDDSTLTAMLHDIATTDASLFDSIGYSADELDQLMRHTDPEDLDPGPPGYDDGDEPERDDQDMTRATRAIGCPHCGGVFPADQNTMIGGGSRG